MWLGRDMWGQGRARCLRMFIDEGGGVVDFVVNDNIEVFLGRVLRYLFVGDFFRHLVCDVW